jgi:predicted lipid-binding transport protein (Tim44 family)
MSRIILTVAAVAAALAFAPRAAEAAMPVSGALQAGAGSDIVLAQAPPTAAAPAAPAATTETPAAAPGAKKGKKQTRQQEAESSVKSGTVPKRYMQNVPKEYHHLIPFDR